MGTQKNGAAEAVSQLDPMLIRVSPWWMKFFFLYLCGEKRGRVVATLHFLRELGSTKGRSGFVTEEQFSRYR